MNEKTGTNYIYATHKSLTSDLWTHSSSKWKDGKEIPCNRNQKRAGVTILTWYKLDSKQKKKKKVIRDKEGLYIMINQFIEKI